MNTNEYQHGGVESGLLMLAHDDWRRKVMRHSNSLRLEPSSDRILMELASYTYILFELQELRTKEDHCRNSGWEIQHLLGEVWLDFGGSTFRPQKNAIVDIFSLD